MITSLFQNYVVLHLSDDTLCIPFVGKLKTAATFYILVFLDWNMNLGEYFTA